jgi:plastocyanin
MRAKRAIVAVAFGALVALGACSDTANEVTMNGDHTFSPQRITIESGETVEFVNQGREAHTVTADEQRIPAGAEYFASGGFSSEEAARNRIAPGLLTEAERYEVTLQVPGAYHYVCLTHEQDGMRGTIVVER